MIWMSCDQKIPVSVKQQNKPVLFSKTIESCIIRIS